MLIIIINIIMAIIMYLCTHVYLNEYIYLNHKDVCRDIYTSYPSANTNRQAKENNDKIKQFKK